MPTEQDPTEARKPVEKEPTEARQAIPLNRMRYVLGGSMALGLAALTVILVVFIF